MFEIIPNTKLIMNNGTINMVESTFERELSDDRMIDNETSNNNVLNDCYYKIIVKGYCIYIRWT